MGTKKKKLWRTYVNIQNTRIRPDVSEDLSTFRNNFILIFYIYEGPRSVGKVWIRKRLAPF